MYSYAIYTFRSLAFGPTQSNVLARAQRAVLDPGRAPYPATLLAEKTRPTKSPAARGLTPVDAG